MSPKVTAPIEPSTTMGSPPELGIPIAEEDSKRPYVEVSGRKGLGVKADDLMDMLIERALAEVADLHPEAPADEQKRVASEIAIGACRCGFERVLRACARSCAGSPSGGRSSDYSLHRRAVHRTPHR